MIRAVTVERARTLERRFKLAALGVAVVTTALYMIGFRMFVLPLVVVCWLLLARSLQWDGWITGYQAARKDAAREKTGLERI